MRSLARGGPFAKMLGDVSLAGGGRANRPTAFGASIRRSAQVVAAVAAKPALLAFAPVADPQHPREGRYEKQRCRHGVVNEEPPLRQVGNTIPTLRRKARTRRRRVLAPVLERAELD